MPLQDGSLNANSPPPPAIAAPADDRARGGVFETIRVEGAEPVRLAQHLARLSGSVEALYGASLSPSLEEDVRAAARQCSGQCGLRITAMPADATSVTTRIGLREVPARTPPIQLRPATVPGGLGAHKWSDRSALDALAVGAQTPLILDQDDSVLEAGWANVFAVFGRSCVTPAADGRLLAGVTREALLSVAADAGFDPIVRQLPLGELERADAILLTSALALVTWATIDRWEGSTTTAAGLSETLRSALLHGAQ